MRPVECQSSATHAGVVQSQHQSLYEDNLRLMRENTALRDQVAWLLAELERPCACKLAAQYLSSH